MCLFWAFHKKWSYIIFGLFLTNFFYLAPLFSGFIHSCYHMYCYFILFFLAVLWGYITFCFFIHQLRNIWQLVFSFWLLWITLLKLLMYRFFGGHIFHFSCVYLHRELLWGFLGCSMVKKTPAEQETACNAEDLCSILGLRKFPGEGNSNSLEFSSLETPWTEETGGLQSLESQELDTTLRLNHQHQKITGSDGSTRYD